MVTTNQVANLGSLTTPNLPGTLPDGFWQEPVNILPLQSPTSAIAYLNGSLYITDLSNGNNNVSVSPAANGGATVSSNLGSAPSPQSQRWDVELWAAETTTVQVSLSGATVNVAAARR